ncbi:molecular chaperone DnaJ [Pseudonocardia humida]|uniref:Chaperone protein DnaJ n=1 Tax=Pseudonocardia humida TaxID=2800819 RepID=A0ABT0ZXD1_9PSEU|nr:molecular chaperone DnaJ [Pseudonocardia humida]MCO1655386.1 molecular chaperone DnaJ [Pseudonocardia humida]
MTQRDWIEKDFYRELGVASSASADEIKKAYRKLARELHPDANPGDARAEARFKSVSEAYGVLSDDKKRREYDETRSLFAGGAGGFRGGQGFPGGFGGGAGGQGFDLNDLLGRTGAGAGGGGLGDLFGDILGGRGAGAGRSAGARTQQRGADIENEVRIGFADAVRGAEVQLRLAGPARCRRCAGTGARPGSTPRTCPTCAGVGLVSRSQGAFAFSEPCQDCRGTGRLIDDPCPECRGEGVTTQVRKLTVRVPAGVTDGQQIRIKGKGEPGPTGGPAGDLLLRVHVEPHRLFGRSERNPDDLTLTVPVTYPELVLGTTITVPTLDSTVSLKVPPGTASGRTFRVRGRGVQKRSGNPGDLLVTVEVAVPSRLDDAATTALQSYAEATKAYDPRADLLGGAR